MPSHERTFKAWRMSRSPPTRIGLAALTKRRLDQYQPGHFFWVRSSVQANGIGSCRVPDEHERTLLSGVTQQGV